MRWRREVKTGFLGKHTNWGVQVEQNLERPAVFELDVFAQQNWTRWWQDSRYIYYPDAHGPSYGGVWGLKFLGTS